MESILARYLAPKPNYSSDEQLLSKCKEENKDSSIIYYICSESAIRTMGTVEALEYNSEHIYPKEKLIEKIANILLGLSFFLLATKLILNLQKLLKGRINVKPLEFTRNFFNFFISRKAELELMRYKRLFENGIITETEFSEKKKELKPKIIG